MTKQNIYDTSFQFDSKYSSIPKDSGNLSPSTISHILDCLEDNIRFEVRLNKHSEQIQHHKAFLKIARIKKISLS